MSRPNVILILTDDQGYGDMSYTGNPFLRTPALDHLQSQSVRFTDFHGCPMCTPTRGELLTGQDSLRNGATFVCMGRSLLRSDLPTAADLFSANDYRTGHFGKYPQSKAQMLYLVTLLLPVPTHLEQKHQDRLMIL